MQWLSAPFYVLRELVGWQGSGDVFLFFILFIVLGLGRMPSSLCHHHDLPQNTPSRAKKNKGIVGVGSTAPNHIPLAAAVNSSLAFLSLLWQ